MKIIKNMLIFFILTGFVQAEDLNFLDNKAIGAESFIKAHPEFNGDDVIIFVLDNGVDPSIKGLINLPNGEQKVIQLRDFSNQLTIQLTEAEQKSLNDKPVLYSSDIYVKGSDKLSLQPSDGRYYISYIDENSYKNSPVKDLNSNGRQDDKFAVLTFKVETSKMNIDDLKSRFKPDDNTVWVYYVDEDANGYIDDEKPLFEYQYKYDTFDFHKGESDYKPMLTMSGYFLDGNIMEIHTCDGSHGSHCAGIAAGHDIYGYDNYNGVAPGANVASLKVGSNTLSGGSSTSEAMKKAYEYGIEFMEKAGFKYAVYSMSYGIGSETPGRSDIEKFLREFTLKHPEVIVVTSNGNNGPGINTTGNPSASTGVISAGAMIAPSVLKDLYGSARKQNWITHFSSRGGETGKPDVIAPGAAQSTVPNFESGDAFWGTSMACPQVAGAAALLFSAALKSDIKVNGYMVKKALKFTAEPMKGYTSIDYGNGLVNINKAWEYLKVLAKRNDYNKVYDYEITTANSYYPDRKGSNIFWKSRGFYKGSEHKQNVSIKAIYPDYVDKKTQQEFYRAFDLESNVKWLKTDKSSIYLRDHQAAKFGVYLNLDDDLKPGLYTGRISAFTKGEANMGKAEFDIQATVVVPYLFENKLDRSWKKKGLDVGNINRYFVEVPAGAKSFNIKLSPVDGKWYEMALYIFSPDGKRSYYKASTDNSDKNDLIVNVTSNDLMKGIWEVIPYCYYQSSKRSYYNLDIEFYNPDIEPAVITKLCLQAGKKPKSGIKIYNNSNNVIKAQLNGSIEGYMLTEMLSSSNKTTINKSFSVGSDIEKVVFDFNLTNEQFNKVTDLAINVYDMNGKAVVNSGLSRKYGKVHFTPSAEGDYKLEIVPGFTLPEGLASQFEMNMDMKYYLKDKNSAVPDKITYELVPGSWTSINIEFTKNISMAPNGYKTFGKLVLKDIKKDNLISETDIILD